MWPDAVAATSAALLWLAAAATAFFALRPKADRQAGGINRMGQRAWMWVVLLALGVRLIPAILLPVGAGYDIQSFRLVAEAFLQGQDVYTSAAAGRHPYLPFQMVFLALALVAARFSGLPFVVWVKMPPVLADAAITGLIYYCFRRVGKDREVALRWSALYALNPISILVTAYHGQFEAVTLLLLLLAWIFWRFHQRHLRSALFCGLAILNKTWPVVFVPLLIMRLRDNRTRLLYATVALTVPVFFTVGYILWFASDPRPMLARALTHTGNAGYWGPTAVLRVLENAVPAAAAAFEALVSVRRWLLLGTGLLILWLTRRQSALTALTTVILAEFAVSAGMGIQWLAWVVPFALIDADLRWLKWYSLTGALFILVQLYGLHLVPWAYRLFDEGTADAIIRLGSLPAWITVVLWLVHRLSRRHQDENFFSPARMGTFSQFSEGGKGQL